MRRFLTGLAALLISLGGSARVEAIIIDSDTTIDYAVEGDDVWIVEGAAPPTTVHVVEDWMELPYMATAAALVKGPDGEPRRVTVTMSPAGARDFYRRDSKSARLLEASGVVRHRQIGSAPVSLMKVRDCHRVLRDGLIKDPCLLLRDDSDAEWDVKACKDTIAHIREKFGQ